MNTTNVDSYLRDGCGRCAFYQTPDCKVHRWSDVLNALRELLRETELVEQLKWGCPTYTLGGKNVVMLAAFKEHCALSFFKGVALDDEDGLMERPGPNSRVARIVKFTAVDQVIDRRAQVAGLIQHAIAAERAGVQVVTDAGPEPLPVELEQILDEDPSLRLAFDELTPGRQRSHIIYISGASQSTTRTRRVQKCAPKILLGKGFNER